MPENTTARDPLLHLLGAMSEGSSGYIENMEADGQRQLVNSTDLPTKFNDYDLDTPQAAYESLGFTFGEPHKHDPMFRPATLPDGWKREGSDHAMWSYIVDQHGRRRVAIFYKAAFYDRDAFMSLQTAHAYLRPLVEGEGRPVLDDEWLTRDVAVAELAKIRDRCLHDAEKADDNAQRDERDGYWAKRASEHRKTAAKAGRLRAELAEV